MSDDEIKRRRIAAAKVALRLIQARKQLGTFIQTVVRDDHGTLLELAPIHAAWIRHVEYCWERSLRAIILAPFGHGKSSAFAVPLIAFQLGLDPNKRIKIVTNDDASATKRVGLCKKIIESATYKEIFPGTRRGGKWTDHELFLQRKGDAIDPSVHARGIYTTGIGGRADIEVFDDIVDQRNSAEQNQRKKALAVIDETWTSRLEPDGKVLYIGTLWHLDDATHHLMQRPGWCTLLHKIPDDCGRIVQEVYGADADYPKPSP